MIRPSPELAAFERRRAREHPLPFERALEVFAALWVEARALNPDFLSDWEHDLEPDLAIARAVNGFPPEA